MGWAAMSKPEKPDDFRPDPKSSGSKPEFDQALADSYVGKYLLVGLTYCDSTGKEKSRQQLHGIIQSASPSGIRSSSVFSTSRFH
ncbi:MAG: hypothetical protein HC933_22075 [Pleurocapsa sp. SU_196_0]|nr:hypothetical protein [Pleurocapsa sp. SU_196_0]